MDLIDTHCHLYLDDFTGDLEAVVQRMVKENVSKCFMPAIDRHSWPALLELEKKFPGRCIAMAGLHPCSVKEASWEEMELVETTLTTRKFAAIGEIGLDFYWDRKFEQDQYRIFRKQIGWALQYDIPIVIHSRDSMKETIQVVRESQNGHLKGIFHCFTGDYESARQIVDLGFYLGIGGVVTYKNCVLAPFLSQIGLEHLVLETDAPYLTPVPFRGKRNEPSYLKFIAKKVAELTGLTIEEVAQVTTRNAAKIFGC